MANKAFEIQNSTLKIGGVELQAGNTGVVIPGVTRATSYKVEEVNDTGDQTYQFAPDTEGVVVVIDAALYNVIIAQGNESGYADYTVTTDGEGYIDEIKVNGQGSYTQLQARDAETADMYAYVGAGSASDRPLVPTDWIQIPFRPKIRAGEIENIGGGGGGTGNVVVRPVNYPYGESGDTAGTIAFSPIDGNTYFCFQTWAEGSSTTVTATYDASLGGVVSGSVGAGFNLDAEQNSDLNDLVRSITPSNGTWYISQDEGDTWNTFNGIGVHLSDNPPTFSLTWPGSNQPQGGDQLDIRFTPNTDEIWSQVNSSANLGNLSVSGSTIESSDSAAYINFDAGDGSSNEIAIGTNDGARVKISTSGGASNFEFIAAGDNTGSITFPDGTVQTTAYQGGGTIVTNLWVACGNNPGGAMAVSSTDGVNWTTHDYYTALPNVNFSKLAISQDKIVYVGTDNTGYGLYYASAPEDTPILAAGTSVYPNSQNPVVWNEINYLGGYFIATGSYTTSATVTTFFNSIVLAADAGRTTAVVTVDDVSFDFSGVYITISGASNAELNGNFQLSYNSLDTAQTGVYEIYNADGSPITLTSTDTSGASIVTTNPAELNWPTFIYSTNGVDWTYGNVDTNYYPAVLGSYPDAEMSDVAYNGTGYLIPIINNRFQALRDNPAASGPGAFYFTDITGFIGSPQFIVGGQVPEGLPGTFNNIACYGDGAFFVSDDKYVVWTATNPTGIWTERDIIIPLLDLFGYAVGPQDVNGDIDSAVCGTVGGQDMFVATTNAGAVIYTTDNGVTFQGSIPDPITSTATVTLTGSSTVIAVTGETPYPGEKITITVANGDDTNWNGTYTVTAWTNPNEYQLFDLNGVAIVSDGFTPPSNPMTVVMSHGRDLDAIHVADGACIVFSHDSYKLYRSTDMVNWTTVFTNQFYGIDDIYYAGRPVTGLPIGIANGENSLTIDSNGNITLDNTTDGAHDRGLFWRWGSRNGGTDAGLYHDDDGITLQSFSDEVDYVNGSPVNIVTNPGPTQNKWSFNTDGGLVFPDNSKQTTAYVHRNINLDGGGAAVHFEQEVGYIDGGFSATRHGVADPTFDGGNRLTESNQYNINGGGA